MDASAAPTLGRGGNPVTLAGANNVRDLGGWSTADGRAVRRGRVFRSDDLADLTEADIEALVGTYGIRTVVDLRATPEIERSPGRLTSDVVDLLHRPMVAPPHQAANPLEETVEIDLAMRYLDYLSTGPLEIRRVLEAIADACHAPILVHCTAGKDRTGVIAALLLSLLGAQKADIIEDYAMTEERVSAVFARLRARPTMSSAMAQLPDAMAHARPATMERFLDAFAATHGTVERWVAEAGLSAAALDELRRQLLVAG